MSAYPVLHLHHLLDHQVPVAQCSAPVPDLGCGHVALGQEVAAQAVGGLGRIDPVVLLRCRDRSQHQGMRDFHLFRVRKQMISGEGPNMIKAGSFQGVSVNKLGEKDIRFTRNKANSVVYAIVLGWPSEPITVKSLGLSATTSPCKIGQLELLGTDVRLDWKQPADALQVQLPKTYRPKVDYAAALKITVA